MNIIFFLFFAAQATMFSNQILKLMQSRSGFLETKSFFLLVFAAFKQINQKIISNSIYLVSVYKYIYIYIYI